MSTWQKVDPGLWPTLVNSCRHCLEKFYLWKSSRPSSADSFTGKILLGDTYILYQHEKSNQRMVLELNSSFPLTTTKSKIKSGLFSSAIVHSLQINEATLGTINNEAIVNQLLSHLNQLLSHLKNRPASQIKTDNRNSQREAQKGEGSNSSQVTRSKYRGIAGIEHKLEARRAHDDSNLAAAFQEGLTSLSAQAK